MIESFVDLTYRGLALGRRVKLTQVRPSTGYLEVPAPMPVGTAITIATDEGLTIEASVTAVHEQVGGSERPPGMTIAPALADDARASWWKARVALLEAAAPEPIVERTKPVTVRPRSHTVPAPPPEGALADAAVTTQRVPVIAADPEPSGGKTVVMAAVAPDDAEPTDKKTTVMAAVDQELLESLTRKSGELEALVDSGDHAIVDDGRATTVMTAIDPAALGLDAGSSGSMPAASDDGDAVGADGGRKSSPNLPGVKKRRKRR